MARSTPAPRRRRKKPVPDRPPLSFTLDDLLAILSKIPQADVTRLLVRLGFPEEGVTTLLRADLVELVVSVWDSWTEECSHDDLLIRAARTMCEASFESFVRLFWEEVPIAQQRLLWNWHLTVFTTELQTVAEDIFAERPPSHDLICNVSPGSSKSSVWSVLFPCWVWARMPKARIITASHTESLVTALAAYSRDVMKRPLYKALFPEIVFTEVQDAKGHYRNTLGGERFTCTVAGKSPTGQHAHFVIIDDPIDPKKVLSEAERRTAGDFLTKVIPSRHMRGVEGDVCATMLVMQRLAVQDPTDVMLETARREGATPVHHICLPAELTDHVSPPELRSFYEGINSDGACEADGLMDPIRLGRTVLNNQRAALGEWSYAGQYLQQPRPPGGGMFKERFFLRRICAAPYHARRIRYWDRAASKSDSACFTAGVLMAYDGEKIYVEDVVHGRWEPDERNEVMRATALRDRARYGKHEPTIYVEREGGSSGRDAWLGVVRSLMGFSVREDQVRGSKDTRAEPWATQLAAGNVWLVDNDEQYGRGRAGWDISGYCKEHIDFRPSIGQKLGRLKDRVDASSGAFNLLVGLKRSYSPLQTIHLGHRQVKGLRVVACSLEELALLDIDASTPSILVLIEDPTPAVIEGHESTIMVEADVTSKGSLYRGDEDSQQENALPLYHLPDNRAILRLPFADLDAAELQDKWLEKIPPWNLPPAELVLQRDSAKSLWRFLLEKRSPPWGTCFVVDKGGEDGRALSTAVGISDGMRLPRTVVYLPRDPELVCDDDPPNPYVSETVKSARHLVVS